jgi:glycosyltransferase involved in cell wall biosynthesis
VENGVDTTCFSPDKKVAADSSKNLVFVGSMDYYPNVEAVISFSSKVWPLIREQVPGARFTIVGANPTNGVRKLAENPGITVTGTVPDVRPYYQDALAAVVPLRTGGGTRLKILEAMASGVPVISTPFGAEGLEVTGDIDILFADSVDASSWVRHVRNLSEMSGLRASLVCTALKLVKNRYDWEILGRKLNRTYREWFEGAAMAYR